MRGWEGPRKFQGLDEIQKKPCNDVKIFFKVALPYLQKADSRNTARYSDMVPMQNNVFNKCMR